MYPHCDARILHAPGECEHCDTFPKWQRLREAWGIAFTGHEPQTPPDAPWRRQLPCPADFNRPPTGDGSDHRRWAGNVATTQAPVNETPASQALYSHRFKNQYAVPPGVDVQAVIRDILQEARQRPGFRDRLRANVAKHRDLLDRLRDR